MLQHKSMTQLELRYIFIKLQQVSKSSVLNLYLLSTENYLSVNKSLIYDWGIL